jgi:hypothetical protein
MRLNPFRKPQLKPEIRSVASVLNIDQRALGRIQKEQQKTKVVLDRHFAYQQEIQKWYPLRDTEPAAREKAIAACLGQISMSKQALQAWRDSERLNYEVLKVFGDPPKKRAATTPRHVGFEQLTIIREKDGDYADALRLCRQAKADGWNGGWDKRIVRLQRKLAKRSE